MSLSCSCYVISPVKNWPKCNKNTGKTKKNYTYPLIPTDFKSAEYTYVVDFCLVYWTIFNVYHIK